MEGRRISEIDTFINICADESELNRNFGTLAFSFEMCISRFRIVVRSCVPKCVFHWGVWLKK